MIKILLSGGLGNQMFQYAAGKALATRLNVPFSIDLFYYTKKTKATKRRFELDVFETNLTLKQGWRSKFFVKYKLFFLKRPFLSKLLGVFSDPRAMLHEAEFAKLRDNTILAGYFQNEIYFKSIEPAIRADFRFKNALKGRNAELVEEIASKAEAVSIHIRRGDYVTDPTTSLAICSIDYYSKAIEYIAERLINPHFFVFSDDMEWVKNNIDFKDYSFILVNWNTGEDSYIDMQLMSLCRHNIIANSSFSWWGAWLNNNPQKIVIAPKQWFKNQQFYDSQCIPEKWLGI
ncbi:alpha-1,2-fucosyltransferase [Viscerimonas tarda]